MRVAARDERCSEHISVGVMLSFLSQSSAIMNFMSQCVACVSQKRTWARAKLNGN